MLSFTTITGGINIMGYFKTFWNDFKRVFRQEFKAVFTDSGVIVVFFLAGLGYPLLYNLIYKNGILEDVPVVVIDNADCAESRCFIREVDATREVAISGYCATMEEAEKLMQERKCHGIICFPSDFGDRIALGQQSTMSIYCDMGSFFYYKNLMTSVNLVMLEEMPQISPVVKPMSFEQNIPYNRSNSFSFFFITAALMLVIQQTMFYGMGMLAGTRMEDRTGLIHGASGRLVFGRGAVYWLIYMMIGMYIVFIVPLLFDIPMVTDFWTALAFLCIYVTACVFFSMAFSTLIRHRETPIVALLFLTLPELFLTGFSWPQACFPKFWNLFSYIFPSTFGTRAYINLAGAGASFAAIAPLLKILLIQTAVYFAISIIAIKTENMKFYKKIEN